MSIKVASWIWEHSKQKSTKLLLLLALADACNDEGVCWPGHKYLAQKCRLSEDRTSAILKELKDAGEIEIAVHQGYQTTSGNTNRYYMAKYRVSIGIKQEGSDSTPLSVPETKDPVDSTPHEGLDFLGKPVNVPVSKDISTSTKDSTPGVADVVSADADKPSNGHEPTPKKERPANPWYDVIAETMGAQGFKNGRIQNVLLAKGKDAYAKYNLDEPLTDPEQVRVFWTWYQKECPGCDLSSVETVQDYVMRWQKEKETTPARPKPLDINDPLPPEPVYPGRIERDPYTLPLLPLTDKQRSIMDKYGLTEEDVS
jgi:hypothetical protein